ncbi:MAG TPA: guanylate kinase [Bacteroidales bacterium]|nr:guanylate kinase [Bacteroidales bacterium]
MTQGKLIILSAPSGSGKTSIVRYLMKQFDNLRFSVSATNRPMRAGETDGVDYHFLSTGDFKQKIQENKFVEWEEVYNGRFYGTLITAVDDVISEGGHVVFDVDVVGGLNIKKAYGNQAIAIFIKPPSLEALADRLRKRESDSPEDIADRLEKAEWEMGFAGKFDHIIVNDRLQEARDECLHLVENFINQ